MKKLLLALLLLFYASTAQAGIISYTALSSDAGVSFQFFNDEFSEIFNEFNGNIEAINILDGSLTEATMADAINPRIRDNEQIGEFTFEGMLPATSVDLTSDISAGTSYVEGFRVVTNATAKTYIASEDTYVYIDINGAFQFQRVANDASQPSDPANSLLLAKVVTDSNNITSVVDLRTTEPTGLRIYQDLKSGLVISRDISDIDVITIGRGEIEFGSSVTAGRRRNITSTTVNFATTGRGGLDTGSLAQGFYFIFTVADDDNTSTYEGIASLSSTDASGVIGERLVGWCFANDSNTISPDSVGAFKGRGGDAPNIVSVVGTTDITTTSTSYVDMDGMEIKFFSSGRPVKIIFTAPVNNQQGGTIVLLAIDGVEKIKTTSIREADQPGQVTLFWLETLTAGEHTIKVRWKVSGGTGHQEGSTEGARILIAEEL